MIYIILFWEFFKIGLLAIGGGLVTIPFLYDLSEKYNWFSSNELMDMIAVSESTPGPIGVNMATYAGFKAAGIIGGIVATLGLLLPSLVIIVMIARYLKKHSNNLKLDVLLKSIRPVALALICSGGILIARFIVVDWLSMCMVLMVFLFIHFVKIHPIVYICLGAIGGIICGL